MVGLLGLEPRTNGL